ncbi:PucR family transcriptional regulator ligand-binding domain-containing protein [Bifidobacterium thermacidophilum]|uniref:PucR family transcriptional regulator n=1 Tax=Bifidobacterium thermacidophilum TaxID=246618 RepID=UPI003F0FA3F0
MPPITKIGQNVMSLTVLDVLSDTVFQRCDPYVAGGRNALGNTVRWAYTHERYDVTQFLIGGEFLIIEGSVLSEHSDDEGLRAYIDSLAAAHVSGLAIELVDFFTRIPDPLAEQGDLKGIPVIGLRHRQPFVTLCQAINTRITRGQLLAHMAADTIMTSLNARLSEAQSAQDVAEALTTATGERTIIMTSDGTIAAQAGMSQKTNDTVPDTRTRDDTVLTIRRDGFTVACVAVSQSIAPMNDDVRKHVLDSLAQTLPAFLPMNIRMKISMRLLAGIRQDRVASRQESADAADMLKALGYVADVRSIPFAIDIRNWWDNPGAVEHTADILRTPLSGGRIHTLFQMESTCISGAFLCDDAEAFHDFSEYCKTRLQQIEKTTEDAYTRMIVGHTSIGAKGLLDAMSALRFAIRSQWPEWDACASLESYAYRHLANDADAHSALSTFIAQNAGALLTADNTVIDTLCAIHDCLGNKTKACSQLGITRQTLYNRLEHIVEVTGIHQENTEEWALMADAAKLLHVGHYSYL